MFLCDKEARLKVMPFCSYKQIFHFYWFCAIQPEGVEHPVQLTILLLIVKAKDMTKSHAFILDS